MRIGLVSYEYPPQKGIGGVGSYAYRLAQMLSRAGHQVVILAGPSDGPEFPQPNVTIHRLPAQYYPNLPLSVLRWAYWHGVAPLLDRANPLVWHWLRWDLASRDALLAIDSQTPLDVVEAPEHAGNGLFVGMTQRWPTVLRLHGPWDLFFGLNRNQGAALNRLMADVERRSARYAHVITTPSRAMAKLMVRRWDLKQPPMVVPNFIDVSPERPRLAENPSEPRIVCAGRIEPFKGQDVLVKAFSLIGHQHPQARLVLIGPDQWARKRRFAQVIEELVPEGGIRARIDLMGPLPLEQTQEELAQAAVAVVPSRGFESFSFSTLEAMALARPIIVSRVGAMPELVDYGRCGRIVPAGDAVSLAGELDRLLSNGMLCQKLGAAAHARALCEYDTAAVLPRVLEAYERAIAASMGQRASKRKVSMIDYQTR
jgi:glycosyltransferase involved in cell wall biosynthesis